jgi:hypothetical protein
LSWYIGRDTKENRRSLGEFLAGMNGGRRYSRYPDTDSERASMRSSL